MRIDQPRFKTAEAIFAEAINARGYAVVARIAPARLGQIINDVDRGEDSATDHPFVVIAVTDRADFEEQCRMTNVGLELLSVYRYFYRVTTD